MKAIENASLTIGLRKKLDLKAKLPTDMMPISLVTIGIGLALLVAAVGPMLFGASSAYWYLSRASAMVAFTLMWASMALGVGITNKLARVWPGAPTSFELHQYVSLLGLAFAIFHVLVLLGDDYIGYNLIQLLVPFASTDYQQIWVGIGQIALYLLIPVTLSFYARKRLGNRAWRTIHGISYAFFALALVHGLFSGTDSGSLWTSVLYWFTSFSLVGLTGYRIWLAQMQKQKKAENASSVGNEN